MLFHTLPKTPGQAAVLAQILELTEEEKDSGVFSRPIHPDAHNFKVVYENAYGIWTHRMLPFLKEC